MHFTQTNGFGRTERMLARDSFHTSGSFLWILLGGSLLILWIGWFLFAKVPVDKMGLARVNEGKLWAVFPKSARVDVGQIASIESRGKSFPTKVLSVESCSIQEVLVELQVPSGVSLKNNILVKVGVEQVSPAALLLRLIMGNADDHSN